MSLYFTNEEEVRARERKEPPPELQAEMADVQRLNVGETEYLDLRQPWLYSSP